ncbi:MAG: hypothetical protein QM526_02205 [Alphaproteobacteria bacterium]|nr:hypothetical protein [Alphaproteobacteria bacterium]
MEISIDDFKKIELRVGKIIEVEDIPNTDKLYKLKIDLGEITNRTICSGIKQHYSIESLIGKKVVVVSNLALREIKGVQSYGMLLCSSSQNTEGVKEVMLIEPHKDSPIGSLLS